jgi:hypothetical protein
VSADPYGPLTGERLGVYSEVLLVLVRQLPSIQLIDRSAWPRAPRAERTHLPDEHDSREHVTRARREVRHVVLAGIDRLGCLVCGRPAASRLGRQARLLGSHGDTKVGDPGVVVAIDKDVRLGERVRNRRREKERSATYPFDVTVDHP